MKSKCLLKSYEYHSAKILDPDEVVICELSEFTDEELIQYVHDKRKIVDIVLYSSLKKKPGKIGMLLLTDGAQ